jgi:acetolactate synthase-1/2/3 large subunit
MMQDKYFGKRVGADAESGFTMPDVCEVAKAYGIHTREIYCKESLQDTVNYVMRYPGPVVCAVGTPLEQAQTPRIRSYMVDGQITSAPMHDLTPELPELEQVMNENN